MKHVSKKITAIALCVALLISMSVIGAFAVSDWTGYTAITNATELKAIESNLAGNYYLANDITMPESWESIGWLDEDTPFTGIFDGNGKTINGLKMNYDYNATFVGLFAINGGTIKNVKIVDAYVSGGTGTGALVAVNKGTIVNCSVESSDVIGSVKNYSTTLRIGGLVGQNGTGAQISDCFVSDTYVTGNNMVGGFVGSNMGTISDCSVTNCKINSKKKISDIYKNGAANVINNGSFVWSYVGGFAGNNQGEISHCTVFGDIAVYGFEYVGGLIGYNSGTATKLYFGTSKHDIPYYNPYNYGNYSFYAEHVHTDIGYTEENVGTATDIYIYDGNLNPHPTHTFGEWTVITPSTCTEDGLKVHECTLCGFKEKVIIPAAHTEGEWTVVTPASCTENGLKELRCAVCNELIDSEEILATGHTEGEWKVVTLASCTENGLKELRCTVCNELLDSEEILATGHTEGEWTVVTLASCTENGLKELHCTICNELLDSEEILATGHTEGEWKVVTPASCTENGLKELRCTVCNELLDSEEILATGHTEGEWTVVTPASCTENGLKELRCTVCNELIDSEEILATGHVDADNDGVCDVCSGTIESDNNGEKEDKYIGIIDLLIDMIVDFIMMFFSSSEGIC